MRFQPTRLAVGGFVLAAGAAAWARSRLPADYFDTGDYMPHGHCYLWNPGLVRLHVVSDLAIGTAYVAISASLAVLVYRARKEIPFGWMFLLFGTFIIACGGTHFMEVWTLWRAEYWLAGGLKLLTAAVSVGTAVVLPGLIPKVLEMLEAARLSRERTAELARANEELAAFNYSASHDLRAPLRRLDSFGQILEQGYGDKLDEEGRAHLARMRSAAQNMSRLIDSLLDLARINRRDLHPVPVDLSATARRIVADLRLAEPERKVRMTIADGLSARGDEELLRDVLANLLANAWKFTATREDAAIEFGSAAAGAETVYCLRDNGVGFDMAYAGKLFKAFSRLHRPDDFPGSGIGLATVKRIIERHGGRIWTESEPGRGTAFYFTLR